MGGRRRHRPRPVHPRRHVPIAFRSILGEPGAAATYHALPRVTFTDPEVGAVGLTEQQARDAGIDVRTGVAQVPSSARGWIHKAGNDGFVKLIEDARRGVLVGATSAGPVGGEVLAGLLVAVHAAVPTSTLREMIYAYPDLPPRDRRRPPRPRQLLT